MSITTDRGIAPPLAGRRRRVTTRLLRRVFMFGGVLLLAAICLGTWYTGGRIVSIDDSYVQAAKLAVSTDVSGTVAEIAVHDHQVVKPGDLLFRLDPLQRQIALDSARAALAQTALTLEAMKRDYQRMLRDTDARAAQVQADQASYDRYASLIHGGGVTRADYDDARFKLAVDQQMVESLKVQAQVQLARLGGDAGADVKSMPAYRQEAADVAEAQRQLDHTIVRAPFGGVVTQVESLQPGQYLPAGTAAFGLVSNQDIWVEANPKETDLTWVREGNPVIVSVDTYPGRTWHGTVESLAPNSGAEFSILPAQNSSGNWVKVVQRIPLRVKLDQPSADSPLRSGMSVIVDIDTGHHRTLADIF
jgi:membrane fusion protein (multidrug efflux system)